MVSGCLTWLLVNVKGSYPRHTQASVPRLNYNDSKTSENTTQIGVTVGGSFASRCQFSPKIVDLARCWFKLQNVIEWRVRPSFLMNLSSMYPTSLVLRYLICLLAWWHIISLVVKLYPCLPQYLSQMQAVCIVVRFAEEEAPHTYASHAIINQNSFAAVCTPARFVLYRIGPSTRLASYAWCSFTFDFDSPLEYVTHYNGLGGKTFESRALRRGTCGFWTKTSSLILHILPFNSLVPTVSSNWEVMIFQNLNTISISTEIQYSGILKSRKSKFAWQRTDFGTWVT